MVKKLFILLCLALLGMLPALAANVVSVGGGSGSPGDELEISVGLDNDADDVAAAEIRIPMPSAMLPVEGSCVKTGDRLAGHSVSASLNGSEYVIVIFNTSLTPIPAGSGEILRFKVLVGDNPGSFGTTPKVKLSDAAGRSIPATATGELLTVTAPRLTLSRTAIDYGRVAIRDSYSSRLTATNTGSAELRLDGAECFSPDISVEYGKSVLAPGEATSMTITYSPQASAERVVGRVVPSSNSVGDAPFVVISAQPYSVNRLTFSEISGQSGSKATLHASLENMEPIAGLEFSIALPEGVEYVEGSAAPAARAAGMSASASVTADRKLRVILFSLSNTPIAGESGEVLSLDLMLGCGNSSQSLWAENMKLANTDGTNVNSAMWDGWDAGRINFSVVAPKLNVSDRLDLGDIVLGEAPERSFEIYNSGQAPLVVERIVVESGCAMPDASFPLELEPWNSASVPVKLTNPEFGNFASRWLVYSNDPDRRMVSVAVTGNVYIPNELKFSGEKDGSNFTLTGSLENTADITALQLDIIAPEGVVADTQSLQLTDRATDHSTTVAEVAPGRYRVIIFSLANKPLTGNSGALFSLVFNGSDLPGKQFSMENIKLSSVDGKNYTTPSTEFQYETVPVEAESVELSESDLHLQIGSSASLFATVMPWETTDKTVVWTSSDPSVAEVDENGIVKALGVGTATVTATCGSASATCQVTVEPIPVMSFYLSCSAFDVLLQESFTIETYIYPEDATDKTVTWESSDPSIASVDDNGTVTGLNPGTAIITARCGDLSAECTANVLPIEATSLILSHTQIRLQPGQTHQLTATVLPENATDKTVTWESSFPEVATVDANGLVTAHSLGDAYIYARCGNLTEICRVIIEPIEAESVVLSKTELTMRAGQSATLTASVLPENTSDPRIFWSSGNPDVANITEDGVITAYSIGSATITATCGNASATCEVTVEPTPAESVTISQSSATLRVNGTLQLTAWVMPEDATDKTLTWTSSDPTVAVVDENGLVKALAIGTADISASWGNISATCQVTVEPTPAESVTISQEQVTLRVGQVTNLTASVYPDDASDKTISWSSSNPDVASVSQNGEVTALSIGSATITATCGNASATCRVTVEPIPVTSFYLSCSAFDVLLQESFTIETYIYPEDATDKTVTWESSDTSIASVDDNGTVTGLNPGTAIITARCGDLSAECTANVLPIEPTSLILSHTQIRLKSGQTHQLTATVLPENATDKAVTWESSFPEVATVDANGLVTAHSYGDAFIYARCGNLTETCRVIIEPIEAESVVLSKTELTMRAGQTATLTVSVLPENTTDQKVLWSSNNPDVASVTEDGVVTALSIGSATISATCNNVSATCEVTVEPTPAESVTISQSSATLRVNGTLQLTAWVMPDDATDKTVTWSSSNYDVVYVSEFGVVTAYSIGSATITATCGNASATCEITVEPTPAESLTLDITEIDAPPGESIQLTAIVTPDDATNPGLLWESSDTSVATVDQTGLVTIVGSGVCVIRVSTTDGSNLAAECEVRTLSGLEAIWPDADEPADVYNANGTLVLRNAARKQFMQLQTGIYFIKGRKVFKH